MILWPIYSPAGEWRFDPGISGEQAARWRAVLESAWSGWESRLGVWVTRPPISLGKAPPEEVPRHLARSRAGRIELHPSLGSGRTESTLRHELAHVFLEARCPRVAAPLISEAFALWITGEDAARVLEGKEFLYGSEARDWVLHRGPDEPRTQRALAKLLSLPESRGAWERYFRGLVRGCGREDFPVARALADFQVLVRGGKAEAVPTRIDFLLVDNHSQAVLAEEGKPANRYPTGSLLKPTFFPAVPALMESRPSGDTPYWDCPTPRRPGEIWTWERALTRSCNGFFLDFAAPAETWKPWEGEMARLGFTGLPRKMEGRIGLETGFRISLVEAARLYAWLGRRAPFVMEALKGTVTDGTLTHSPHARWFRKRGIALKTGTVSDLRGVTHHAWIVAVASGYTAVIHGTGLATHRLLGELQRRILDGVRYPPRPAEVQILGMVPSGSLGLSCDGPLFVRDDAGRWRAEPPGSQVRPGELRAHHQYLCPVSPVRISFPEKGGRRERAYQGLVKVTGPLDPVESSLPLGPKAARARRGSRLVLETSERHFLVDSLLSEYPRGHGALLEALALVMKHNLGASRHGDRPPCDTTHCHVFGHGGAAPRDLRRKAERAVDAVAYRRVVHGEPWMPFHLGGSLPWRVRRGKEELRQRLDLRERIREILRTDDGQVELVGATRRKLSCETFRNQLGLLSCPERIGLAGEQWEFSGKGEGHGLGLDLTAANVRAAEGRDPLWILSRFFPGAVLAREPR